jgi:hypothetical protein
MMTSKNNGGEADWVRILDALETVGEREMLAKLEACILGLPVEEATTMHEGMQLQDKINRIIY